MSKITDLDDEFTQIEKDISDKIRAASALLIEAGQLSLKNNLSIKLEEYENLTAIVNEIAPPHDWDESEADSWTSSSNIC